MCDFALSGPRRVNFIARYQLRSSPRRDYVDKDVAEDHRQHHDAESAAEGQAAVQVKLSAKGRTNQLIEHLQRVERELDAAEGLGQEWVAVRLALCLADRVQDSDLLWHDIDRDLQAAIDYSTSLLVLGYHVDPELSRVLTIESQAAHLLLRLQELVIIVLSEAHLSFGQLRVLNNRLYIEDSLSDQVIRLEKIQIVCLHLELVVFRWMSEREEHPVIPRAFAVRVAEVRVCILTLVSLKEASDEAISCPLSVHHFELLSVPNDHSYFEVLGRLFRNVVFYDTFLGAALLVDFSPKYARALRHRGAWVNQLAMLNWLVQH